MSFFAIAGWLVSAKQEQYGAAKNLNPPGTIGCFGYAASKLLLPHLSEAEFTAGQSFTVASERPHLTYFPVDCLLSIVSTEGIEALSVGREGWMYSELGFRASLPLKVFVSIGGRAWAIKTVKLQELAAAEYAIQAGFQEACQAALLEAALVSISRAKASRMGSLARWLYRVCEVTGRKSLPISHANLAALLGTRRQTITTCLAELEGMNLIVMKRTLIDVRDMAGLAQIRDKPAL